MPQDEEGKIENLKLEEVQVTEVATVNPLETKEFKEIIKPFLVQCLHYYRRKLRQDKLQKRLRKLFPDNATTVLAASTGDGDAFLTTIITGQNFMMPLSSEALSNLKDQIDDRKRLLSKAHFWIKVEAPHVQKVLAEFEQHLEKLQKFFEKREHRDENEQEKHGNEHHGGGGDKLNVKVITDLDQVYDVK